MADAFQVVDTVREATRKSEVVRDSRMPQRPMELVAMTTQTIAVVAAAWFMRDWSSGVVDQVSVVLLVALGLPHVDPASGPQQRVHHHAEQEPRQRQPDEDGVAGGGRYSQQQGKAAEETTEDRGETQGQGQLGPYQCP